MDELRIKFISDPGAESDNTVICGGFQRLRGAATGSRLKRGRGLESSFHVAAQQTDALGRKR